ncbi:hypothetical protein Tco_0628471 [Tanacetum coccineum]|uniref:Reverse transcriptase domain-containing protein n=1 Tax=Tanacetum coccineum TaxID=301880 RepID=A0ABQ4WQE8_9ASTR
MVHRQRSLSLKEVSVKEIPSPRFSFLLWWWLFKSILEACDKGFYKGVYLAKNKSNISLLKYADDALFSSDWSRLNASNLIHILKCFELASGLKVNITKSRLLGVGAPCNKVELMASSLGCAHDSLPFTYLGLSVGKKMRGCDGWNSIISRFRDMLSSWKAKYLLIGAQKVINILESIRCIFFWGFKDSQRDISWVKWNTILLDMDKGGLGVGSLLAKNLSLLRKWKLRFLTENNSLWRKVINEFYGNDRGFGSSPSFYHVGGIWHDINKAASSIEAFGMILLRRPLPLDRLKDSFPRLYALENVKDSKVTDRWCFANNVCGGNWSWRVPLHGRAIYELSSLISLIGNLSLYSNGTDKWIWTCDASGKFKVSSLTKSIQKTSLLVSTIFGILGFLERSIYTCGDHL